MNIEAIAAAAAATPVSGIAPPAPAADISASAAGQFGQLVSGGLAHVNDGLMTAQAGMQSLAAGTAPDLHRVMIQIEESQLSFQLMLQVRNRLLESYQDVMKMQV